MLDGEGGFTVWGRLMPAADSLRLGALPIGLAHQVRLRNPVKAGTLLRWADVVVDESGGAVRLRREMEAAFPGKPPGAPPGADVTELVSAPTAARAGGRG
jgi:predicted homoserine dehydrogenase-like protein